MYAVCVEEKQVAKDLPLEYAILLIKAIMEAFQDPAMAVTLIRQHKQGDSE